MKSTDNNLDSDLLEMEDFSLIEDLKSISEITLFNFKYKIFIVGLLKSLSIISTSKVVKDLEVAITSNLYKINKAINDILKKDKIKKVQYEDCVENKRLLNEYIDNNFRNFKFKSIFTTPDELIKREINNHIDIAYHINCIRSWINSLIIFNVTFSKNDSENELVFKILKECNIQLLDMKNQLATLYLFQNKEV